MSFNPISIGSELAGLAGKVIDRIWPDATEKQKADASRIVAEMLHDENVLKIEMEDRTSARDREGKIATSADAPLINKVVTPVLALGTVGITFILFGAVLFQTDLIDSTRKDLAIYILGALTAVVGQVISYYFGSSSGSTKKSDYIESLVKK